MASEIRDIQEVGGRIQEGLSMSWMDCKTSNEAGVKVVMILKCRKLLEEKILVKSGLLGLTR